MNKKRVVVDSSVWIEVLSSGQRSKKCLHEISSADDVYVPTLVIFEVYRKLLKSLSDDKALAAIAYMNQYKTTELSHDVALLAGDLSIEHKLATSDSIILAHAHSMDAVLITMDNDFAGLTSVKIIR